MVPRADSQLTQAGSGFDHVSRECHPTQREPHLRSIAADTSEVEEAEESFDSSTSTLSSRNHSKYLLRLQSNGSDEVARANGRTLIASPQVNMKGPTIDPLRSTKPTMSGCRSSSELLLSPTYALLVKDSSESEPSETTGRRSADDEATRPGIWP